MGERLAGSQKVRGSNPLSSIPTAGSQAPETGDPGKACRATATAVAWCNGRWLDAQAASLPLGDAGFVLGASVTEQLRTFRGRPFLVAEHAARFGESLRIVGIDPSSARAPSGEPLSIEAIFAAAEQVALRAWAAGEQEADVGIVVCGTPGDHPAQHGGIRSAPRLIVHAFPLAFAAWWRAYDEGIALRRVGIRQVPEACWPSRLKCRSRMHYHLADREADAAEPGARAVLEQLDGSVSETSTANIVAVRAGRLTTPPPSAALGGVSLGFLHRLAVADGLPWTTGRLTADDLAAADELLLTSTPSCILPATHFEGQPIGGGRPGPIYRRLLARWSGQVGLDIAGQARRHGEIVRSGEPNR